MNLRLLEYIITISEQKSLSRAAEKLDVTQPALSQQLKKLEKELGARLFVREKNQLQLTDAGKVYVNGARSVLSIYTKACSDIARLNHSGKTQVTMVYNTALMPDFTTVLLPAFKKIHPDVLLSTVDGNASIAREYLLGGIADVAVMACRGAPHNMLEAVYLHDEELLLAMPAGMALAEAFAQNGVDLRQLKDAPFILNQSNSFFRGLEQETFLRQGITPHVLCEISDLHASLQMVKNNKGCAFIPRSMLPHAVGVRCFALQPAIRFQIVACWHKGAVLTRPAEDLVRVMLSSYAARG